MENSRPCSGRTASYEVAIATPRPITYACGVNIPSADVLLVPGLWLPGTVWAASAAALRERGHRPLALTLPGQGDGATDATLADQLAYVLTAIDAADHPVLVGHSAASTLVWIAASHRPARVRAVIMIGGFPAAGGGTYADFFPIRNGVVPFPGWEAFEQADVADLDEHDREELRAVMVPVPEGVATGKVTYEEEQRFSIPVGLVCPEFSTEDAKAWITRGDVPELARVQEISYVDLDSGHWPMRTCPTALAEVLHGVLTGAGTP